MSLKIVRAGFLFSFFALICISGDLLLVPVVLLGLNKFQIYCKIYCRDLVRVSWGFFIKVTKICGYLDYKFELTKLNGELKFQSLQTTLRYLMWSFWSQNLKG
ncbi:hypothetical protein VB002_05255 [Campylobacter concisus]